MTPQQQNIIYLWAHQRRLHGLTRYHHQGYDSLFPNYYQKQQSPSQQATIVPFKKK